MRYFVRSLNNGGRHKLTSDVTTLKEWLEVPPLRQQIKKLKLRKSLMLQEAFVLTVVSKDTRAEREYRRPQRKRHQVF